MCGVMSSLTQQTVVPTGIDSVSGLYAKFEIAIWTEFGSQFGGGGPTGAPLIAGVLPTSAQTAMAIVNAAK